MSEELQLQKLNRLS